MHFIRKLIHDQVIEVLFFPIGDQVVDIFTKSLTEAKFSKLRSMLGVQEGCCCCGRWPWRACSKKTLFTQEKNNNNNTPNPPSEHYNMFC
jgi:hypothetical protein